jgi:hypothetical protein
VPGPEHPRRVGGPPFPTEQGVLDGPLVAAKQQHIDVAVVAQRTPQREFDRVPAGQPPGRRYPSEKAMNLSRGQGVPDSPSSVRPRHIRIFARPFRSSEISTRDPQRKREAN